MISLSLELQVRLCAYRLIPKRFGISHWSFLIFLSCFHTRGTDTDPLRFLDEGAIYFSSLLSSYWIHVQWKRVQSHKELLPMLTMFWHVLQGFTRHSSEHNQHICILEFQAIAETLKYWVIAECKATVHVWKCWFQTVDQLCDIIVCFGYCCYGDIPYSV